jgi:Fur family ferric uptake transcriptional regulator
VNGVPTSDLVTVPASLQRFASWLGERELPVTPQRLAIADVVLSAERHISAEEVARALGARGTRVGTATVYRTLDVLVESGLVVERDLGEGFLRYEPAREEPVHDYLHCMACGAVEEFHDDAVESLSDGIAARHGFSHDHSRLVIQGFCRACRSQGPRGIS